MPRDQLHALISLAKIDGIFSKDEIALIYKVAHLKGISRAELNQLFIEDSEIPPLNLKNLTQSERFDYLYTIVQLIRIDERFYREELHFCRTAAHALDYDDEMLFYFFRYVHEGEQNRLTAQRYIEQALLKRNTQND